MLDTGQLSIGAEALLWYRKGLSAAAEGNFEHAVACFDRVSELHPEFCEAWFERGLALEAWGYYVQAISSFDHALNQFPPKESASQIWHERGNALQYGLGKYAEAIACYDQALNLNPINELALQNRGNALLYGLSRAEDAITYYDQTLKLNPENQVAWRNRGNAMLELRRYDEAIACYDRALAINAEDDVAWHARLLASERAGLISQLPTTRRAACVTEFEKPTFIEVNTDTFISYSAELTLIEKESERESTPQMQSPLLVIEDDWGRREVLLEKDQYLIGRDPAGDIQLHSQFASRQHATLIRLTSSKEGIAYRITDGNPEGKLSTNGLLINGQKLLAKDLITGDAIVFGPGVRIIYRLEDNF
jgi:tetratricopeptide (TPR) repeat protein